MAKIKWKTQQEIEDEKNAPSPLSEIDKLKEEVKKLENSNRMHLMALMELDKRLGEQNV